MATATSGVTLTTGTPSSNPSPPQILALQSPQNVPVPSAFQTITNGLHVPPRIADRLANFPEEIYTLLPTDNLVKLIKILVGQAGAGQYRSRILQARLQTVLSGANFYDLDGFYGALFGVIRLAEEIIPINPYTSLATYDEWGSIYAQDASYRSRIAQFGKAVSLGASAVGMQLISEAILQTPCIITEDWTNASLNVRTWSEADELGTWSQVEGMTWYELEHPSGYTVPTWNLFTITPANNITLQQAYALRQVLEKVKPANTFFNIDLTGYYSQIDVPIQRAAADSSYWQLVQAINPITQYVDLYELSDTPDANGFYPVLHPPFSEYQGEEIVYNPDIIGVVGYTQDVNGKILSANNVGVYTCPNGALIYYPPNQAIAPKFFNLSGRLVSDGILQSNPYSTDTANVSAIATTMSTQTSPPTPGTAIPAIIYVDGIPLAEFANTVEDLGLTSPLGKSNSNQYYWASPQRPITDTTTEVVEIRLVAPRLINTIQFQLAHFPQTVEIETFDSTTNSWSPAVYAQTISNSVPAVLTPSSTNLTNEDPQHSAPGSWDLITVQIPNVTTPKIRFLFTRNSNGTPPLTQIIDVSNTRQTITTNPVPYSLALQDVTVGYNIYQQSDLPTSPIFTSDALGSQVEWSVRQELPSNALSDTGIAWRSNPQPAANAVVNFFLDVRDDTGNGQLIDQMFIDPLYMDVTCNLYYSNQNPSTLPNDADSTQLIPPLATNVGSLIPTAAGLSFTPDSIGYIDIKTSAVPFEANTPWWWGTVFQPTFYSNQANGETIWDTGQGLSLTIQPGNDSEAQITLKTADGQFAYANVFFSPGDIIYAIAAYVPMGSPELGSGIYVFAGNLSSSPVSVLPDTNMTMVKPPPFPVFDVYSVSANYFGYYNPTEVVSAEPTDLYIGASIDNLLPANLSLMSMVLKQEIPSLASFNTYIADYPVYTLVSEYQDTDPTGNTSNTLMRFNPTFLSNTNLSGFLGGPGYFYDALSWTPIIRDYICQKGTMNFNPTLASFWKLEFTNLSAQPLNSFVPITQTFKTHQGIPASIVQSTTVPIVNSAGSGPPGTAANISSATSQTTSYSDSTAYGIATSTPTNPNIVPPTATLVALDQNTQAQMTTLGWYWQYQQWNPNPNAPKFVATGVHNYSTSTVNNAAQVGYFAGLNAVSVARLNFGGNSDEAIYDVSFADLTNIDSVGDWELNPGDLFTNSETALPAEATGSVISSTTPIIGLQFASAQSDAVQIAFDDNFQSPLLQTTDWTDTTMVHAVGDAVPSYSTENQSINVFRNIATTFVTTVLTPQQQGTFVRPPDHPIYDEGDGTLEIPVDDGYGGIATSLCDSTTEGNVWAAVRLTVTTVLNAPLELQIVDAGSGETPVQTVLSSVTFTPTIGQTIEQTVGYQLGSVMPAGNQIFAQIVQTGTPIFTEFIVNRLSLFDEGIVWAFSNNGGVNVNPVFDIRNNAYGTLSFATPGNQLVWTVTATRPGVHINYLRLRPIYATQKIQPPEGIVRGPNLNIIDQSPPIQEDPLFNGWTNPVPYSWFAISNTYPILPPSGIPATTSTSQFYLRETSETLTGISDDTTRQVFDTRLPVENIQLEDVAATHIVKRALTATITADAVVNGGLLS